MGALVNRLFRGIHRLGGDTEAQRRVVANRLLIIGARGMHCRRRCCQYPSPKLSTQEMSHTSIVVLVFQPTQKMARDGSARRAQSMGVTHDLVNQIPVDDVLSRPFGGRVPWAGANARRGHR